MCYFCPDWESKTLENIAISQLQKWKWNTLVDTNLYVVKSERFLRFLRKLCEWLLRREKELLIIFRISCHIFSFPVGISSFCIWELLWSKRFIFWSSSSLSLWCSWGWKVVKLQFNKLLRQVIVLNIRYQLISWRCRSMHLQRLMSNTDVLCKCKG